MVAGVEPRGTRGEPPDKAVLGACVSWNSPLDLSHRDVRFIPDTVSDISMVTKKLIVVSCVWLAMSVLCHAQESAEDYVPKLGEFPPLDRAHYIAGELVFVDHVNRMGVLHLVCTGDFEFYRSASPHRFALLPYGTVRYHGAPAAIRDIPIGTLLHGYFFLPPEGDETVPPLKGRYRTNYKYTHAVSLEDDFSFYQRQGRSWKIESIDLKEGKLDVSLVGKFAKDADGLTDSQSLIIDPSTRVWLGRQIGSLQDLKPGQQVQMNLTWCPEWINRNFKCRDIWLDVESQQLATEHQRQVHIQHMKTRWLPGWVEKVERGDPKHSGKVTVTLFGGMDPSLYKEFMKSGGSMQVTAATETLRTSWQHGLGAKSSKFEVTQIENPPYGDSGVRVKFAIDFLREGFRPGRIVRVRHGSWDDKVELPVSERITNASQRVPDTFQPKQSSN